MSTKNKKVSNVFIMSLPMWVELFMQFLVGNVDQVMLSQFSEDAVASIVNANQIINVSIFLLVCVGNACLVRFTYAIGKKDKEMYHETFFSANLFVGVYCVLITLILWIFGKNILQILNIDPYILDDAYAYIAIVAISIIFQGMYTVNVATLRSKRLLRDVMYVSVLINVLNIVGNVILINGYLGFPQLGIVGAGISTCLSKTIGCVIIYIRVKKLKLVSFRFSYFRNFPKDTMARLLYTAIPSAIQTLSYNFVQLVVISFINQLGNDVVATKGYCFVLANFAYLYSFALAQANQIIVGTMVGENAFDKTKPQARKSLIVCLCCSMGMMTVLWLFSDYIFLIFSASDDVMALGKAILFVDIFLEGGRAMNLVMSRMLTSMGDMEFMVIVAIVSPWTFTVGLGILLGSVLGMGLVGFWLAMMVDEIVRGSIYSARFFKVKWTTERVFKRQKNAA